MKRLSLSTSAILAVSIFIAAPVVFGQTIKPGEIKLSTPSGGSDPRPTRRINKPIKTVDSATTDKASARTGSLSVVSEPGATIYLEPIGSRNKDDGQKGELGPRQRLFIFNPLKPGRYRVSTELDGYENAEGKDSEKEVTVMAGVPASVEFRLRRITYTVKIKTNVKTGEVRYAGKGEAMRSQPIRNNLATLLNVPPGNYDIEITTTELGYLPLKQTIEIGAGKTEFEAALDRRLSEKTLSAIWTSLEGWDAPTGPNAWVASGGKLTVNKPGIALPESNDYRYYADFELVSDVRLVNDVGASIALRAQDKRNYYLVNISGGKAAQQYFLTGYVVTNGVPNRLQPPIPLIGFASSITGPGFELTIKVIENKISVLITDQTGSTLPLGDIVDSNRHFMIGAPGIVARDQEQIEIGRFIVQPLANSPR